MPSKLPQWRRRPDEPGLAFLPTFFVGILLMVGAVIVIARTDSDVADAGAVALMIVLVVVFAAEIIRRLGDDD